MTISIHSLVDGQVFDCPIDLIASSSYNPRLGLNPDEDNILQDLKVNGFVGTFDVTLEPGAEILSPRRGGNTRVKLFHQLHAAGDTRFDSIPCKFHKWPGTAEMIASGALENINRGDMGFISGAVSCMDFLTAAHGDELQNMSTRARADYLRSIGWKCDRQKLTLIEFLSEQLLDHSFVAKQMTSCEVVNNYTQSDIKGVFDCYKALADLYAKAGQTIFQDVWVEALMALDSSVFAEPASLKKELASYLEKRLADVSGKDIRDLRVAADARMSRPAANNKSELNDDSNSPGHEVLASEKLELETTSPNKPPSTQAVQESRTPASQETVPVRSNEVGCLSQVHKTLKMLTNEAAINGLVEPINSLNGFSLTLPQSPLETILSSRTWWFLLHLSGLAEERGQQFVTDPVLAHALATGELTEVIALCGRKPNLAQYLEFMIDTDSEFAAVQSLISSLIQEVQVYRRGREQ